MAKKAGERPELIIPTIAMIELDKVDANPQNKEVFSMSDIDHLADIIAKEGYSTPIEVVRKDGRYEIISGHRRVEAMKRLGYTVIPAIFLDEKDEDKKTRRLISSNIATRQLTPLDMARAISLYRQVLSNEGYKGNTRKEIARYFGISEISVYRHECLLKLIPQLQEFANRPLFPYSCMQKVSTMGTEDQKKVYDELIRMEAEEQGKVEDEIDRDEITLSRVRVEQIINTVIRQSTLAQEAMPEEEERPVTERPTDSMNNPIAEFIEADNDENLINFDSFGYNDTDYSEDEENAPDVFATIDDPAETIKSESEDEDVILHGLDACITTVQTYADISPKISNHTKDKIRQRIKEMKKAIEALEKFL